MADPTVRPYTVTANNVKVVVTPTATMNLNTHKVAISFKYLINSFDAGSYLVQHRLTPDGGSVGSWTASAIAGATISTNGGVLKAKNRDILQSLTWNAYKDLLPQKYTKVESRLTLKDSTPTSVVLDVVDMGVQDLRVSLINLQQNKHGTDTTPIFSFDCPKAKKSYKVKPVLEYGSTADLSTIDHTITAFQHSTGSGYSAGDATNGNTVPIDAVLKLKITATTAMAGTEYWRVRLVPVSFV